MKLGKINREQARQIMETINPISVCDCNGRLKIYDSPASCYSDVLKKLFYSCPRGFIDIPLFMRQNQHIRLGEAIEYCGRRQYALLNWEAKTSRRDTAIKNIFYILLRVSGCSFSENAFKCAMYDLDISIKLYYKQK